MLSFPEAFLVTGFRSVGLVDVPVLPPNTFLVVAAVGFIKLGVDRDDEEEGLAFGNVLVVPLEIEDATDPLYLVLEEEIV